MESRAVEKGSDKRRRGIARDRHELSRLIVGGRDVDDRAEEGHRIFSEFAIEVAAR